MSTKQFNTRIQHKIDTIDSWEKAQNFKPLKGEMIIYTSDEETQKFIGIKIGNGKNYLHELSFISTGNSSGDEENLSVIDTIDPNSLNPVTSRAIYSALNKKSQVQFITWEAED